MVSGVGFQNTNEDSEEKKPRKKMVSRGLLISIAVLAFALLAWLGLSMWEKSLKGQVEDLRAQTMDINTQIGTTLSKDASDFAVRAHAMEKNLYHEYTVNDILHEVENIMIRDESGNRVVLKSFQYNAGARTKKTFNAGSATITGAGGIVITADADTFDVMAQQIDVFKKSPFFSDVRVGTTDRDDAGRIVFTLTMNVATYDKSPYENVGGDGVETQVMTTEDQEQAQMEETQEMTVPENNEEMNMQEENTVINGTEVQDDEAVDVTQDANTTE